MSNLPVFTDYDFHIDIAHTGTRWHLRDNGDGTWSTVMSQDVEPIIDDCQGMQSESGISKDKTFFRMSRVPLVLLEDWRNLGIDHRNQEGAKRIVKMLGSNEYSKLRTSKEAI